MDFSLVTLVCEILRKDWDPIGVGSMPGAEDEYDSYAPSAVVLVERGATSQELFDYLWQIETVVMCQSGDRNRTQFVAETLAKLRSV